MDKKTSPSHLRNVRNPNLRVQDGPKYPLLCTDCEIRFSQWEQLFFEKIFLPLHNPEPHNEPIFYGDWGLKFAVSVSWRVILYYELISQYPQFTPTQIDEKQKALEQWRLFLLDKVKNPGIYSQHLLPFDVIENYSGSGISPFFNSYILRTAHLDVIAGKRSAFVYTKMCRIMLFGRIYEERPKNWKGMNLRVKKGQIRPRTYHIPQERFDYWNEKADDTMGAIGSISKKQRKKIEGGMQLNLEEFINSEMYRAFLQDYEMSGYDAFSKPDEIDD